MRNLILCEVLQGVGKDAQFDAARTELPRFEVYKMGTIELAVEAATNYRGLRAVGRTVRKAVACLIATLRLVEGHSLLHNDRDYDPLEMHLGLRVVHQ